MTPRSLLVLGGTSWLGGAVARHAQYAGLEVTCLARGVSGSVPEGVTSVGADRDDPDTAYTAVAARDWDAVVDVARQPRHVRGALDALGHRVGHWVFVSTCSVYADNSTPGDDESAELHEPWSGDELAPDEAYGPAKVACEQAVLARFPDALVARSGLIVGYGDRSDRFGYWPARFAAARAAREEELLVAPRDQAVQVVDVEDLAAWLVRCAVDGTGGVVNAMGPTTSLGEVFALSARAAGLPDGRVASVDPGDSWLQEQGVEPWMGPESLPLWLPQPAYAGFMTRDVGAAVGAGLSFRPLSDSVADALRWERERGLERGRRAGLTRARERELLAAWRETSR